MKIAVNSQARLVPHFFILLYYVCVVWVLCQMQWAHFTWLTGIITFYVALWTADFNIGLIHLYIDYKPLNTKQGFGLLYDYAGDRSSQEFQILKQQVMKTAHWLDKKVYTFKIHHRNGLSNKNTPYSTVFFEFFVPGFIFVLSALAILLLWGNHPLATHLAFFDVVYSFFAIHAQYIHYSMHGSKKLKFGNVLVQYLSKLKLIYSYKTHAIHHKDGHTGFCFIAGHANFAVNFICKQLLKRGLINTHDWHGIH